MFVRERGDSHTATLRSGGVRLVFQGDIPSMLLLATVAGYLPAALWKIRAVQSIAPR